MFLDEFDKVLVVEVTGSTDNEIVGREVVSIETGHDGPLEFFYGVARAQDRQTESMVLPETLGENLVDKIVRIILIHFYFFEDDAALARDIAAIEDGMKDKIAGDIHGEGRGLIADFDLKRITFFC